MYKETGKTKSSPTVDGLVAQWYVHIQLYAREHGIPLDKAVQEFAANMKGYQTSD